MLYIEYNKLKQAAPSLFIGPVSRAKGSDLLTNFVTRESVS